MGTSRDITTQQLEFAKAAVKARVEVLKQKGSAPKDYSRDPQWRELNAKVRQIGSRIRAITETETINAHIEAMRVDAAAKRAEKRAAKKQTVEKAPAKPAKAKAPKGEGKGEGKPKKEKAGK